MYIRQRSTSLTLAKTGESRNIRRYFLSKVILIKTKQEILEFKTNIDFFNKYILNIEKLWDNKIEIYSENFKIKNIKLSKQ